VRSFRGQTFVGLKDIDTGRVLEDVELERCTFEGCGLSRTIHQDRRTIVRNVVARNCRIAAVSVGPAIFEDVLIDGLAIHDVQLIWGASFRHVTLRGRIGRIAVRPTLSSDKPEDARRRIADANRSYYQTVDWALDISGAEFAEFEGAGIPGRLIRRDPETQVVVTRAAAQRGDWRQLDLTGTWWAIALEQLAKGEYPDEVFVAPKRHRKLRQLVAGLRRLQDAGIAEPG
jgi:hypothetical protein